jgi:hypothetical protein
VFADGLCSPHYKRKWRYGDPLAGGPFMDEPATKRFARLYTISDSGCWEWTGALDRLGYGQVHWQGRRQRAHRAVYEATGNVIPDGLELDHLCRNKRCVNPSHLEPVTHSENLRRHYATVTECPQGHPYDDANTYITSSGKRRCRTCRTNQQRQRRARKRGA